MMRFILFVIILVVQGLLFTADAQQIRTTHRVQSKETVFGIAKSYGLTLEEIIAANPEMSEPNYKLRKGDIINIPYPATKAAPDSSVVVVPVAPSAKVEDITRRAIRVGVMLPINENDVDGRRMTEYYRGVLMGIDSLKQEGVSTDVYAWNLTEGSSISAVLSDSNAAKLDLIIGPLYAKFVPALSAFAAEHGIKLLIPFSIAAPEVATNEQVYQVYQPTDDYNSAVVAHFTDRFRDCRTVLIDCSDPTSTKAPFTSALRSQVESLGRELKITSLKTPEEQFIKAFATDKPNVVVLNTSRSSDLTLALAKLRNVVIAGDSIPVYKVSLFGYTEWLAYTRNNLENFYLFDTYIPSTFFYNAVAGRTMRVETKYRWNFHTDMIAQLPRLAITGFDHAYFFIKGMATYGKVFTGAKGAIDYPAIQTPLHFERYESGGYKNGALIFIHYTPDHRLETIRY